MVSTVRFDFNRGNTTNVQLLIAVQICLIILMDTVVFHDLGDMQNTAFMHL